MKRIRITHPVFGLIVTAMIGAGCLAASKSPPSVKTMEIVAGDRIGPIRLGMTDAELEQAMGKSATEPWQEPATAREYPGKGMTVLVSKQKPATVTAILAGNPNGVSAESARGTFNGRTAEGLGMGSTCEEVKTAYGTPDEDQQPDRTVDFRLLGYHKLGIQFGLNNGRVTWLAVRKFHA